MDQAEPQRMCGQCRREVAESNFTLHEMHCRRFLCVCPDCEETVPREQLEQHRQEQHSLVRCSKCSVKVERCYLSDHESDECVERLQKCNFCELELPWRELHEHCMACGSRTELCVDCGRYVTLRDQRDHSRTCSSTEQLTRAPAAETEDEDQNKMPVVTDVALQRLSTLLKSNSLSDREARAFKHAPEDTDQIGSCSNCHLVLPLFTLRWHEVKCQRLQPRK